MDLARECGDCWGDKMMEKYMCLGEETHSIANLCR